MFLINDFRSLISPFLPLPTANPTHLRNCVAFRIKIHIMTSDINTNYQMFITISIFICIYLVRKNRINIENASFSFGLYLFHWFHLPQTIVQVMAVLNANALVDFGSNRKKCKLISILLGGGSNRLTYHLLIVLFVRWPVHAVYPLPWWRPQFLYQQYSWMRLATLGLDT